MHGKDSARFRCVATRIGDYQSPQEWMTISTLAWPAPATQRRTPGLCSRPGVQEQRRNEVEGYSAVMVPFMSGWTSQMNG